jgi:hypothetical protein
MTNAPRLSRRAGIALSVAFAYVFYASFSALVIPGLLPWITELPVWVSPALYLAFAVSLFAGTRIYTLRSGRLTTFARFGLGLPLLVAALVLSGVVSDDYGFYLLFAAYPLFLWIGLVGIPAWLIAVGRRP